MAQTWRTTHGDMSDEEWELVADLVAPYWTPGSMGRPVTVDQRHVVDAIFYVGPRQAVSGEHCPETYLNWNSVHRQHLEWSRNGTWEQIAAGLAAAVRVKEGRDAEPSAGIVDARSVHAGATVFKEIKGYDAGKRINGRKTFGIVDTLGLLMAVVVVAASTSDNTGGMSVSDRARGALGTLRQALVRLGLQAHLHRALPQPPHRRRGRQAHPPRDSRLSPSAGSWNAPGPGS